jgi:hypothetical protein
LSSYARGEAAQTTNSGEKSSALGKIKKAVIEKQAGPKQDPEENQIGRGTDASGKKTEPKIESRNREQKSRYKITQNKNTPPSSTTSRMQNSFFLLKNNKIIPDSHKTLSSLPHFIIGIKICLEHTTLNLGMQMTIREMERNSIPLGFYL